MAAPEPGAAVLSPQVGRSSAGRVVGVFVGVLALAAGLRLWRVGEAYELFLDEVTYTLLARSVYEGQGVLLHGEPFHLHPPGFFSVLALAIPLVDAGSLAELTFGLRPVPALFGAVIPALVAVLVHRVTSSWPVAVGCGLLLALDPFLIRFDSRVLLEAQAMAAATAGLLLLHRVLAAERRGERTTGTVMAAGAAFCAALLTKETYASVAFLPLLVLLVTGGVLRRRTVARVLATTLAGYLAYVLTLALSGEMGAWIEGKTGGIRRLLGLSQITGFNQEGHVSFGERLLANVGSFGVTYVLIGLGAAAAGLLAAALRRGSPPGLDRRDTVLLLVWWASAAAHVAYAVTLGTHEEQMHYPLVVMSVPVVGIAAHALLQPGGEVLVPRSVRTVVSRTAQPVLLLGLALALALALDAAVWWRTHTTPDDGYARFLVWADRNLPAGSTVAVTDVPGQFLLCGVHLGVWNTGDELHANEVDYVLLSSELVRQGYSEVDDTFLQVAQRGRPVFHVERRSLGEFGLYDVSALTQPSSSRVGDVDEPGGTGGTLCE